MRETRTSGLKRGRDAFVPPYSTARYNSCDFGAVGWATCCPCGLNHSSLDHWSLFRISTFGPRASPFLEKCGVMLVTLATKAGIHVTLKTAA